METVNPMKESFDISKLQKSIFTGIIHIMTMLMAFLFIFSLFNITKYGLLAIIGLIIALIFELLIHLKYTKALHTIYVVGIILVNFYQGYSQNSAAVMTLSGFYIVLYSIFTSRRNLSILSFLVVIGIVIYHIIGVYQLGSTYDEETGIALVNSSSTLIVAISFSILISQILSFYFMKIIRIQASQLEFEKEVQAKLNNTVREYEKMFHICANCKNIRDDAGKWHPLEGFMHDETGTEFSHGICPSCMESLYPEFNFEE